MVIYNCPKGKGQNKNKGCDLPQAQTRRKEKTMTDQHEKRGLNVLTFDEDDRRILLW